MMCNCDLCTEREISREHHFQYLQWYTLKERAIMVTFGLKLSIGNVRLSRKVTSSLELQKGRLLFPTLNSGSNFGQKKIKFFNFCKSRNIFKLWVSALRAKGPDTTVWHNFNSRIWFSRIWKNGGWAKSDIMSGFRLLKLSLFCPCNSSPGKCSNTFS